MLPSTDKNKNTEFSNDFAFLKKIEKIRENSKVKMNPSSTGETSIFQLAYKGDLRQIQAFVQEDPR